LFGLDGRTCWEVAEPKNEEPVKLVVFRDGS
jgi:hypothetical protein